jgi:hypothetical protein
VVVKWTGSLLPPYSTQGIFSSTKTALVAFLATSALGVPLTVTVTMIVEFLIFNRKTRFDCLSKGQSRPCQIFIC